MTALYIVLGIIAAIILIIYILLRISVCAYVKASNEGFSLSVKYLWFELYKLEKSFKKEESKPDVEFTDLERPKMKSEPVVKKTADRPKETNRVETSDVEPSDEELLKGESDTEPEEKKKGVKEIIEEYKPYLPVAKRALKKLLKMIRFYDFDLKLTVGDEDAYKAAMKFGKINSLVYSVIALLCCAFTVDIKHTEIGCSFESSETLASISTVVKVRPSAVLALAIYLGINYLKLTHNQKKKEKSLNKEKENSHDREEQ